MRKASTFLSRATGAGARVHVLMLQVPVFGGALNLKLPSNKSSAGPSFLRGALSGRYMTLSLQLNPYYSGVRIGATDVCQSPYAVPTPF